MEEIRIEELCQILNVNKTFIEEIEREGLVSLECREEGIKVCSQKEARKIRLIHTLINELGVNLAGVEVILHMREKIIEMRRQFDQILEQLALEIRNEIERK
jgi:MerR family transcriptional regulator/heat shock protein HspR